MYRIALMDSAGTRALHRWAIQVREPLRVVQTLPRDRATEVPTNVGIELTFSHSGVRRVEERFHIEPAVRGRFEVHGRAIVFVPFHLEEETEYAVRLDRGVGMDGSDLKAEEDLAFRFRTGSDEDDGEPDEERPRITFHRPVWEASPASAPVLGAWSGGDSASPAVAVTVYRMRGTDEFTKLLGRSLPTGWSGYDTELEPVDTSGLPRATSFRTNLEDSAGGSSLRFPRPLPPGYYLVEVDLDGVPSFTWLQVTEVSSYVAVTETSTLVWVNDLATEAPLANATVRSTTGEVRTKTGSDGVAVFPTGDDGNLIVTASDGRSAVIPLDLRRAPTSQYFSYPFEGDPEGYWRFLYAERHVYRPTDLVRLWGLARARTKAVPLRVTLEITGDYAWEEEGPYVVARRSVTTSDRGTFIGSLPIEQVAPGWYTLQARVGDQVLASTAIEVRDFVKPAYQVTVTSSPRAVFVGEQVRWHLSARFFEGSPVVGALLSYEGFAKGTVRTDSRGEAVVTEVARMDERGVPEDGQITVSAPEGGEGDVAGWGQVQVFSAATSLDAETVIRGKEAIVEGSSARVDLSRINRGESEDWEAGPDAGRRVRARIVRVDWVRVQDGVEYDPIEKASRPTYTEERRESVVGTEETRTDARGRFRIPFPVEKEVSYEILLSAEDDMVRTYSVDLFAWGGEEVASFQLELGEPPPFRVGDRVELAMREGSRALPAGRHRRYIFIKAQKGLRDYSVERVPAYSFAATEKDVPNVSMFGVQFTGKGYRETEPVSVGLDLDARRLKIDVTPNRGRYRPGETANIRVAVRDEADRPVRAEVLVTAVDEALVSLEDGDFDWGNDILSALYEPISSGIWATRASHVTEDPGFGGGGEGEARDEFQDVPLFERVVTDTHGRARVAFRVPDNLTSWRIAAVAVTQDLHAGTSTAGVEVGLPAFIALAMNDSYLVGERPAVRARAYGSALSAGDPLEFTLSAPSLKAEDTVLRGSAFSAVDIPLPPLTEGTHRITIRLTSTAGTDAVVRTINVRDSRLQAVGTGFREASAGEVDLGELGGSRPASLVLTDRNRGRYYPVLRSLSVDGGDRVDQVLARRLSRELLAEYFGEEIREDEAEFKASRYQADDGGIAIYPYADSDVALSARIASLAADRFDRTRLAGYLRHVMNDPKSTRERSIVSLYGLASLSEPLVQDVRLLSEGGDLSAKERLYVGLAAAELGDDDTARRMYSGLVGTFAEAQGRAIRLRVPGSRDDVIEATSLGATLGALLSDEGAPGMFEFSSREIPDDFLTGLEQVGYLTSVLPNLASDPVRISYEQAGERVERTLPRGESLVLRLLPKESRSLGLRVIEGRLGVSWSFPAPIDATAPSDPWLSLRRSYNGTGGSVVNLRVDSLVRISLSWSINKDRAASGCHEVTDLLPSGLRAVTNERMIYADEYAEDEGGTRFPYAVEGQRVSFCVSTDDPDRAPIVYYARAVSTGQFVAEPAVIQSQRVPGNIAFSQPVAVAIG